MLLTEKPKITDLMIEKDGNLWKKFCKDKKLKTEMKSKRKKKCFGKLKNENDRLFEKKPIESKR
jgi:hypothetical protein